MGIKDDDARLLCRVMLHDGECVDRGAIVEILDGDPLERVMAAVAAKGGGADIPDGHVVVRYIDGVVKAREFHDHAVAAVGFWPFRHEVETLMPLTRAAAWWLAQVKWAGC